MSIIAEIQSKGLDKLAEDFKKSAQAGKELNSELQTASSNTNSLTDNLNKMKQQLAGLQTGSKEFKELEGEIKAAEAAMNSMYKNSETLKREYRELIKEVGLFDKALNDLERTGNKNTQVYRDLKQAQQELKAKAGELKDQIGDLQAEISTLGSDTRGLDLTLRGLTALSGGFQAVQGASVLFGKENKKLEETLVKLNAVMSITQGLQVIQEELSKKDSLITLALGRAKQFLALAIGQGSTAMKIFRGALLATGIGALILAVTLLITNFDKLKKYVENIFPSLKNLSGKFKELKEQAVNFIKTAVLSLVNGFIDLYNNSSLFRYGLQALGATIISLKDIFVAQIKIMASSWGALFSAIKEGLKGNFGNAVDIIKNQITNVKNIATDTGKKIFDNFQNGFSDNKIKPLKINDLFPPDTESKAKDKGKDIGKKTGEAIKQGLLEQWKASLSDIDNQIAELVARFVDTGKFDKTILDALIKKSDRLKSKISETEELIKLLENNKPLKTNQATVPIKLELDKDNPLKDLKPKDIVIEELPNATIGQKAKEDLANLFGISVDDPAFKTKLTENLIGLTAEISSGLFSLAKGASDARLAILEDEKNRGVISEKKYQEEVKKEKIKQAKIAKAEAVFNIGINIAQAITKAIAQGGIAGIAIGAIMSAIGLAQLAIVASKPLPAFKKGIIDLPLGNNPKGDDTIPAMLHEGESVMTAEETKKHKSLFKAIRGNKYEDWVNEEFYKMIKEVGVRPSIFDIKLPQFGGTSKVKSKDVVVKVNNDKIVEELYWIRHAVDKMDRNNSILMLENNKLLSSNIEKNV